MIFRKLALCFAGILILTESASAQPVPKKDAPRPDESTAFALEKAKQKKIEDIVRVHGFVNRVQGFQDLETKVVALARFADLLWKDDELYARQLFIRAIDLTSVKDESSHSQSTSLARLRVIVLALLAQRDASLAKRITDTTPEKSKPDTADSKEKTTTSPAFDPGEARTTNFKIAYDLLATQPDRAIRFAELSLQGGVFPYMNLFLLRLRPKNETVANALFLETLGQLVRDPTVDPETLLRIGTYVFTSPRINPNDPNTPPDTTTLIGVGDLLVVDVTADRPNVPPALVRAYIDAAAYVLARPVQAPEQRPGFYVAGYLLLPKAARYAPEMTAQISAAMQALIHDIPRDLTEDSTYANFSKTTPKDLDEGLKEISKEQDEQYRDEQYLSLFSEFWGKRDFTATDTIASKVADNDLRGSLRTLTSFGEGARALEKGHESVAGKIAAKMPQGVQCAVLWLGVARAQVGRGDLQAATESINFALVAARHVDDARRPLLVLSAASQLAKLDRPLAQVVLGEAVKGLNNRKKGSLSEIELQERIEVGGFWRYFSLQVKGVDFGLEQTLPILAKTDREATLDSVQNLTGEEELAQALVTIARNILE